MPKVIILGSSNAIPTTDHENTHMVVVGKLDGSGDLFVRAIALHGVRLVEPTLGAVVAVVARIRRNALRDLIEFPITYQP